MELSSEMNHAKMCSPRWDQVPERMTRSSEINCAKMFPSFFSSSRQNGDMIGDVSCNNVCLTFQVQDKMELSSDMNHELIFLIVKFMKMWT